ncbi:MAG: hypothetical protein ABI947_11715 [Chloroflexota bacterium]
MIKWPFRRNRRYWLRLIIFTVLMIIVLALTLPMGLGASTMWLLIHPRCSGEADKPTVPYQSISIPTHLGGIYHGYFIPGSKKATVIVPPPYNSNRGGMLPEASLLAADGFNVLLYESRVCAGQTVTSLGYSEVDDVGDVLAYLNHNADNIQIDMTRVALHGFSSAGATSTMATARYAEIRAVLAEGGYHNIDAQLGIQPSGDFFLNLIVFGARATYRLSTGEDAAVLTPIDSIKRIPPRAIFLVYGTAEISLPGAREQLAVVQTVDPGAFVALWEVPGAGHGGYLNAVGPVEYQRHVLPFYNCALLDSCEAWRALWVKP